ncbi:MAG: large conductance mechanosensitive channel protein MscL [Acholeplasmataceae bacterium]|nr:large conductance mechanosensitive channel protein MscL [Acholeplasmataceae bacterium]
MKKIFGDFKKFITKGNVLDLAVAVIIGGAFSKIIGSLVKDVLMPVISLVVGKDGFDNYKYVITPANIDTGVAENAIYYGLFIQNVIDFLIIAFVVFLIVRIFTKVAEAANAKKIEEAAQLNAIEDAKKAEQAKIEAAKPKVEDLLSDIKVLLEKNLK